MSKAPLVKGAGLLVCLILVGVFALSGQQDSLWFRKYTMDSMRTMRPTYLATCENDAVLVIEATAPLDSQFHNRSALVRIDRNSGDIIWHTRIRHNPVAAASQLIFLSRGLVRLRDGSFIVLFDTITESGDVGFTVNRIAPDGSVIWYREYGMEGQAIYPHFIGLAIGPDSMSFAVSARRIYTENPSSTLLLYHIDEDGNVIDLLDLSTGLQFYNTATPFVVLHDSTFVVTLSGPDIDLNAPKILWRISRNGEITHAHTAWDKGWWADLRRHPNGNIVALSQAFSGSWENREQHGMRTTMYTPDLDTVWSRVYNNHFLPFYFREIDFPSQLSFDRYGHILAMGDGSAYNGVKPAHFVMYDTEGEVQWVRRIGISPDFAYVNWIVSNTFLEQGGILFSGSMNVNGMVLARLDSMGCVVTDCEIDHLIVSTADPAQPLSYTFLLSPNPAADEVIVSLPEDEFQMLKSPTVYIMDITGRLQASFPLSAPRQSLDIGRLPAGLYLVAIENRGMYMGVQKLIKW